MGTITHVALPETTNTGKQVQECIMEDDTGQVKLKLWDPAQINRFKVGDKIMIENCWVREFPVDSGDLQVSPSKLDKYKILIIPPAPKEAKTFNPFAEKEIAEDDMNDDEEGEYDER